MPSRRCRSLTGATCWSWAETALLERARPCSTIPKSSASTLVDDSMSAGRKDRTEEPSVCSPFDSPFSEPVVVPIEDFIDLHAFSPRDIPSVVEQYLEQCIQA